MNVVLPVSAARVGLALPCGADDMMLREAPRCDRAVAAELLARLAAGIEVLNLPVYDFEFLLLRLRSAVFGDRVVAEGTCRCGERVDIRFGISDFLAHNRPRRSGSLSAAGEPGWFRVADSEVEFRLPTVGDQLDIDGSRDGWKELARRCVRPSDAAMHAEAAMYAVAPPLSAPVAGVCPHCRRKTKMAFDVPSFVLRELRAQAAMIYEEVHLLASEYNWTEEYILTLPRARRARYAELIRAGRRID